jgi:hypothetical protein
MACDGKSQFAIMACHSKPQLAMACDSKHITEAKYGPTPLSPIQKRVPLSNGIFD